MPTNYLRQPYEVQYLLNRLSQYKANIAASAPGTAARLYWERLAANCNAQRYPVLQGLI